MYVNQIYELSMVLDNKKFRKVLNYAYNIFYILVVFLIKNMGLNR